MYRVVNTDSSSLQVDANCVARLVSGIGDGNRAALASAILELLNSLLAVQYCSVLMLERNRSPRLLSGAGWKNHWTVFNTATVYAREYFRNDSIYPIVAGMYNSEEHTIVVHRQAVSDVGEPAYRKACYDEVGIVDRLSIVVNLGHGRCITTNLYKDKSSGSYTSTDVEVVCGLAKLFANCAVKHYAADVDGDSVVRNEATERIGELCPDLTEREREVILRILDGITAERIAEDLGISPTTVVTYRSRAYQKLGVSTRRELFAIILRQESSSRFARDMNLLRLEPQMVA
ncbi:helix-turn-helix transcriptional regulator [Paraburkholderia sp. CNPSo 3281]|uniref:helix-turn-helix transcriptional regulator n=1 Tax=Paraburkholderia sp. CNPSo 3281 TaxID=2940933 RepID=UPI0020B7D63D|nr:helix-turn-helix transcriptional regulator [Paraburkholderia sp. CNPSo 3281]MCP3720617.1 helix-turn-helix transcriptional regulator [Paraburkholderia sp. CNPSo 3281]